MKIPTWDHTSIFRSSVGPIKYYFVNYRNLYRVLDADKGTKSAVAHFQRDIYSLGKYLKRLLVDVRDSAYRYSLASTDY
jgi:hypothetical protein